MTHPYVRPTASRVLAIGDHVVPWCQAVLRASP